MNDWAKILDNKGQVDTFILDFEKAFDTAPHELLHDCISCTNLSEKELGSEKETWYCKAECGLCSDDVLNNHKTVQCDKCEMWVHNDCSFVTDIQYETMHNSRCTWICPKCEFFNFSDSFFSEQLNLEDQNRFL